MGRASHLILVLILVYVCFLNVIIIHFFWNKFVEPAMPRPAPPRVFRNTTRPELRERAPPPACTGKGMRALVITTHLHTGTNDLSRQTPVFSQLRQALRIHSDVQANVFLVATAESFMGSHRAWCNTMYTQTQHRVSCKLLLMPAPVREYTVFEQVLAASPCTTEVVLLPDVVGVRTDFFSRLEKTHPKRVTCLVVGGEAGVHCPQRAFRVPRLFMEAYTGDAPVETAARGMHIWGGRASVL